MVSMDNLFNSFNLIGNYKCIYYRILTQGAPPKQTALVFRIGRSTCYEILYEVTKAIVEVLGPMYVPVPTLEDWIKISQDFYELWQFPLCVGCLDGKHIYCECPANSDSANWCYKKRFSFILMALADAYRRFIWYNIGDYGK